MMPKQFQLTIGRMLAAMAWIAVDLALFDRIRSSGGAPLSDPYQIFLILGAFGITCAIPGALVGKTLHWCGIGLLVGFATFGALLVVRVVAADVLRPWMKPPWWIAPFCLGVGISLVLVGMKLFGKISARRVP